MPPWRERRWWSDRLYAVSWIVLAGLWVAIVTWAMRIGEALQLTWEVWAMLHLLLLAAWPIAGIGAVMRRRWLVAAAVVTLGAQLVIAWPMISWSDGYSGPGKRVTIASLNAYVDNTSLEEAGRQIAARPPDILVVQEFTPGAVVGFERSGLSAAFEHRIEHPAGTTGTAVYSRYPMREVTSLEIADQMVVDVELPNGTNLRVVNVHMFGPQPDDAGVWYDGLRSLDGALEKFDGPWVAIGDFNATFDHRSYRDLLGSGRRDAHLDTGRGGARSWPAGSMVPALALIDHAIMSPGLRARSTSEHTISGTDHRMIKVDLAILPAEISPDNE